MTGVVSALALTGCVAPADVAAPTCDPSGRNTLVLMAQSVPEAQHVPCIDTLPSGWFVSDVQVKSGHTRIALGNDRSAGAAVVVMGFAASCETGDAVEVPSDEVETRRFTDVEEVADGYRGTNYVLFDGGCMSLQFTVRGERWSALVNDASAAFALTRRRELVRYVREYSNGVIQDL